jgi:hypothetical protein
MAAPERDVSVCIQIELIKLERTAVERNVAVPGAMKEQTPCRNHGTVAGIILEVQPGT